MELIILCAVLLMLSVAGVVWDFTSGMISSGVDGIFMLLTCLLMAAVFGGELIVIAWRAGLLPKRKSAAADAAPSAAAPPAPKPAPQVAPPATEPRE